MKFVLLLIALLFTRLPQQPPVRVFLAGDSTMSNKEPSAYPETGWGMPFAYFWDSTVQVINRAKNGRSTKTFRSEGLWQAILNELRAGDYVLIQFGHNDESVEKQERYAPPDTFRYNLQRFVQEVRQRGGLPVLITPVTRRRFDANGIALETHVPYSNLVREVAAQQQVPLLDLDARSRELLQQLGPETSRLLFLHLQPGEHPNYPEGKTDNTHFNELGARLMAQLVLQEMQRLQLPLVQHVRKPLRK